MTRPLHRWKSKVLGHVFLSLTKRVNVLSEDISWIRSVAEKNKKENVLQGGSAPEGTVWAWRCRIIVRKWACNPWGCRFYSRYAALPSLSKCNSAAELYQYLHSCIKGHSVKLFKLLGKSLSVKHRSFFDGYRVLVSWHALVWEIIGHSSLKISSLSSVLLMSCPVLN